MDNYHRRAQFYRFEYTDMSDFLFLSRFLIGEKKVLECPCGVGRTLELHARFKNRVSFGDKSITMLEGVRKKCVEMGLINQFNLIHLDITRFDLKEKFDLIIVPKESFQLLTRNKAIKALRCLKQHLSNTGRLLIDVVDLVPLPTKYSYPEYLTQAVSKREIVINSFERVIRDTQLTFLNQNVRVRHSYRLFQADQLTNKFESVFLLNQYRPQWFRDICDEIGLKLVKVFCDYPDSNPQTDLPRRIYEFSL